MNGSQSTGSARGQDVTFDNANNCYVVGYFRSEATFDNITITSAGDERTDLFIAKYSSIGELVWVRSKGIAGYNHVESEEEIEIGPDGYLYIAGRADSNFLLKYDTDGNFVWGTNTGYIQQKANDLAIDSEGNIYITGGFQGSLMHGGIPILINENLNSPVSDCLVIKYNPLGEILWAKRFARSRAWGFKTAS